MRAVVSGAILMGLVIAMPYPASAVNCDQVRRYLSTGRSVEDVAETMIVSVDDVKKCQQGDAGDKKAGAKPDDKPAPKPQPKQ
ncbi:MAG TPA: hypothetical protein VL403_07900 [Candidatus Kryptonia bacterium]|nr:hypothetical protein [Candidatus Kryptonia bacterium]